MGLAQFGDERIDVGCLVGIGGGLADPRSPRRGQPVMLGARVDQLVLDEALVDWQHRDRVDLRAKP